MGFFAFQVVRSTLASSAQRIVASNLFGNEFAFDEPWQLGTAERNVQRSPVPRGHEDLVDALLGL
jgi:hypothetical protein